MGMFIEAYFIFSVGGSHAVAPRRWRPAALALVARTVGVLPQLPALPASSAEKGRRWTPRGPHTLLSSLQNHR